MKICCGESYHSPFPRFLPFLKRTLSQELSTAIGYCLVDNMQNGVKMVLFIKRDIKPQFGPVIN